MLRNKLPHVQKKQTGFTLVEMLIVAPIVILVLAGFVGVVTSITGSVLASKGSSTLVYNIQDALNRIEQDVKISGAFLATNNIQMPTDDVQGYLDDATSFHNADATAETSNADGKRDSSLILNAYATGSNPINLSSVQPIPAANEPNACTSSQVAQNTLVYVNIVYFVRNNSLWRRTVVPSNYATIGCSTTFQQGSCANGVTSATYCKALDIDLVDGITSGGFTVNYYPTANSTTANTIANDPTKTDAVRAGSTGLLATNTVGVTISAAQTFAGRTVKQVGTIRATSANNDTTATTTATPPVIATQPATTTTATDTSTNVTISSTATTSPVTVPATAITVQWQQSTDSGTTWTSISGATSTTLTLASTTVYMNGYQYRALFSDAATQETSTTTTSLCTGNGGPTCSNVSTLSVTSTGWTPLQLQAGWSTYGSPFAVPAFRMTSSGLIVLKGFMVRSGSATAAEIIASLPIGYRPGNNLIFENSSNGMGRVDVWADGGIRFQVGTATSSYSLDGVSFMPSTASSSFVALTGFQNSWVNYTNSTYANPLGYYQASDTRINLKGTISSGTTTDGTPIIPLPSGLAPTGYEGIAEVNSNSAGTIGLQTSSNNRIEMRGGGNSYLSMNALFYPNAYTGWITLPAASGSSWVAYGSPYSLPRYTKSADGMVLVKGLVKSGTTTAGSAMFQLPSGYRPAEEIVSTISIYSSSTGVGTWGRVDILPTGVISVGQASSVNATWTALDSISFYADGN